MPNVTATFTTSSKTWQKTFPSVEDLNKYRKFAFAKWRAKCNASSDNKTECVATLLLQKAHEAGQIAADSCTPIPMIVQQHLNMADDDSPIVKEYHVPQGICGFAWINIRPANSKVAKLAISNYGGRKSHYEGGVNVFVQDYGQSYEKKMTYANAFASVLIEAGIKCYPQGRLD